MEEVDISYQTKENHLRKRKVAAFDMDSTLIQIEVIDELAKLAGVGQKVSAITERAMRGEIDFNQSFKERVSLLKGLEETALEKVASNLPITEGVPVLTKTLKNMGYKLAILSGGFDYFANILKERFGFDYVFTNKLEIEDGKVTGRVNEGEIVNANRKAELLEHIAKLEEIPLNQVIAVGDGANDLKMIAKAGFGVAFQAKPIVREQAEHSISKVGLDGLLYLIGVNEEDFLD